MRRFAPSVLVATFAALIPAVARAQTPTERAVRAVADSFFDAVTREKWDAAAAFIEVAHFERYFKRVVSNARTSLPTQHELTVEQLMAGDTTMPRVVAEWEVARSKKFAAMAPPFGDMSQEFAGVHSQQDLFALTPSAAAARWLEAQDMRTMQRDAWRRSGCPVSPMPQFPAAEHTILAIAVANDSTAYVIHADEQFPLGAGDLFSREQVMPLHRLGGRWRIEPRSDLIRLGHLGVGFSSECPKRP